MSVNTYLRPNIHQNNPEILGVKIVPPNKKEMPSVLVKHHFSYLSLH
jgi:hypothetical protein